LPGQTLPVIRAIKSLATFEIMRNVEKAKPVKSRNILCLIKMLENRQKRVIFVATQTQYIAV